MKTIIAGSRTIRDYDIVVQAIKFSKFNITEVVSGTAQGVDQMGEAYAKNNNLPLKLFPADWKGPYGKSAGMMRNNQMADYADALIAVWDGISRGTKQMIDRARYKKLQVYVLTVGEA